MKNNDNTNTSTGFLRSASGYSMPFEDGGEEVEMLHDYEADTHAALSLKAADKTILSVAHGMVTSLSGDAQQGCALTLRHGDYEVTYSPLADVSAGFGARVEAGTPVGRSVERLDISVRYRGEAMDAKDFLRMLFDNVHAFTQLQHGQPVTPSRSPLQLHTPYDTRKAEIEELMARHWLDFFRAILSGAFTVDSRDEQQMRHLLDVGYAKRIFFQQPASLLNPFGLGDRAETLASKYVTLVLRLFENYLATAGIYLSGTADDVKKND